MSNQTVNLVAVEAHLMNGGWVSEQHIVAYLEEMPTSFTSEQVAWIIKFVVAHCGMDEKQVKTGKTVRGYRWNTIVEMLARKNIYLAE